MRTLNYIGGAFNYVISNSGRTFCLRLIKGKRTHSKCTMQLDQNSFVLWCQVQTNSTWRIDGLPSYVLNVWVSFISYGCLLHLLTIF